MSGGHGTDDTIRLKPPAPSRRPRWLLWAGGGVGLLVIFALAGWFLSARASPMKLADEAQIDAHVARHLTIFRYRSDPAIIVLDFPDLHEQGLMLDRVAALIEKAGEPRDRVLDDAQFKSALAAAHETVGTYYYGHDYPASAIALFFRLAARDGIVLNRQEKMLRALADRLGWDKQGAVGAVISVPAAGPGHRIDQSERAVILHHELSHGAFFTDAAYRAYVARFWTTTLSPAQRQDFRAFLGGEGYDMNDDILMMNEMQAYLIFTRDRRFFDAAAVNMSEVDVQSLRRQFIAGMPDIWLRGLATEKVPGAKGN